MSKWSKVGDWIKENAGTGASLVGSLITGNYTAAMAKGISLVTGATGTDNPEEALNVLQNDPESIVKLKELYYQNEENIRSHLEEMTRMKLEDSQKAHNETQTTIRAGDKADAWYVKATRPAFGWVSLIAAIAYVFQSSTPDVTILTALLTLPFSYMGLRQYGKWTDSVGVLKAVNKK